MAPYATAQHQAAVAAAAGGAAAGGGVGGSGIGSGSDSSSGAVLGEEESAAARVLEYVCAHGHLPLDNEDEEADELLDDGGVEAEGKEKVDSASSSSSGSRKWASTCSKRAPLATVKSHDILVIVCVSKYPAMFL